MTKYPAKLSHDNKQCVFQGEHILALARHKNNYPRPEFEAFHAEIPGKSPAWPRQQSDKGRKDPDNSSRSAVPGMSPVPAGSKDPHFRRAGWIVELASPLSMIYQSVGVPGRTI